MSLFALKKGFLRGHRSLAKVVIGGAFLCWQAAAAHSWSMGGLPWGSVLPASGLSPALAQEPLAATPLESLRADVMALVLEDEVVVSPTLEEKLNDDVLLEVNA